MKKHFVIIVVIVTVTAISLFCLNQNTITRFINESIYREPQKIAIKNNEYSKNTNYDFVSLTDNFLVKNNEQFKNIIYTILNSGNNTFTFYCSLEYKSCIEDFDLIANNQTLLSDINNYVHPFNSFSFISFSYSTEGSITMSVTKKYTQVEIETINNIIDSIMTNNIDSNMNDYKKIEIMHDYIINNSKYNEQSNKSRATDILINHEGICSAYADTMSIFLYKFKIDNIKISSQSHIWNLVYLNNNWLHLDLTFDDPITNTNENLLLKDYMLINSAKLSEFNDNTHNYNKNNYKEAN